MADLGLDVSFDDEAVVLRCRGDLDLAGVPKLEAVLDAVFEDSIPTIVLDLTDLRFMDSQGIGVLVRCWQRSNERDKRVVVRNPCARVAAVLELTGLPRILEVQAAPVAPA